MKVEFQVSKLATVTGEGDSHKAVFAQIAGLAEVFSIGKCGKCTGDAIVPVVRQQDKFTYYEFACLNTSCRARLSLGQSKDNGELYPRRKYHDKHPLVVAKKVSEGDYIPCNGWEVYVKENVEDTPAKKGK